MNFIVRALGWLLTWIVLACEVHSQTAMYSPVSTDVRYEVRAVWLTTLMGLDWPSRPAKDEQGMLRQKQELGQMLDRLQAMGINTVLFQARLRATTSYASSIEPWDAVFAGKPGLSPSFDPLQTAVTECHKRGMECHAWVVAFPVCKVSTARQLGRQAITAKHPELCQRCGEQWMMDPGVPGTAPYLADICAEIVRNYDVDGIHLDYIRYPEPSIPFNDAHTYARYGKGWTSKAAWRTANVDRCVKAVHDAVKAIHPWVKLSCSPVGKYADLPRYSSYGWNARDAVSQDAQRWLREGWMDMLFPMMYFDGNHFYPFLADWNENKAGHPVCPGLGIYFLSEKEKDWPLQAVQRQLNVVRDQGLGGQAFFRAKYLLDNVKGLADWLKYSFYASPALVPPMQTADGDVPDAPQVRQTLDGLHLHLEWNAVKASTPKVTYNVYRVDSIYGTRLLAIRQPATSFDTHLTLPALRHSQYVVTAVDAYGRESLSHPKK